MKKLTITVGLTTNKGRNLTINEIGNIKEYAGITLGFASITEITGYYKGGQEKSLEISHITSDMEMRVKIQKLASYFAETYQQDSVMYTEQDIVCTFIS